MLILHLLDIEKSKDALYGIALEIEDLASHVVLGIFHWTIDIAKPELIIDDCKFDERNNTFKITDKKYMAAFSLKNCPL